MKASMEVSGAGHVQSMLKSIAKRVPDTARGQMKRSSNRIVKLAQLYVPEDTGALRDSIRIEKSYGTHGRLEITIVAGNTSAVRKSGKVIDLNRYALLVHEAYETAVAPNGPGQKTREKILANPGVKIGSRFLFRAMQTEAESFERVMVGVINQVIREEQQ